MSIDFLNISKKSLKANLLQKASSFLDEKNEDLRASINYIIPVIYSGIIHNTCKNKSLNIYHAIKEYGAQNITTSELEDLFSGENSLLFDKSYDFLNVIFHDNSDEIKKLISNSTRIHQESVVSLQKMVLPLVLKPITKYIETENLNRTDFEDVINNSKTHLYKHISADFLGKLVHDIGFYSLDYNSVNNEDFNTDGDKKRLNYFKLFSGVILISLIGLYAYKNIKTKPNVNETKNIIDKIDLEKIVDVTLNDTNLLYYPTNSLLGKYIKTYEDLGFFKKRKLKNGEEIFVLSNGGVNKFIDYLTNNEPISKQAWFDLNRVFVKNKEGFDLKKSESEIKNLIQILNAYPNISIKIGGMTDNEGPADINFNKSFKLAEAFKNILIERGINSERIKHEGYGENYPIKNNDSDQKHLNNRVTIRLIKK